MGGLSNSRGSFLFINASMSQLEIESRAISLGNLDLLARKAVEGFIIGLHKSPFHGFSVEFAEHRLYNPGESTKNIDWKVYARTDKMFTKKYEEETNLRCQILIDNSSSMYYPQPPKHHKIAFASLASASLMNLLMKQRDAFGLSIFNESISEHIKPKSSRVQYNLIISQLEKLRKENPIQQKTNVSQALHRIADSIHKRSLVILFSDMLDNVQDNDELYASMQHLKYNKHEVIVFHTLDYSTELDFDFEDRPHEFTDSETGKKITLHPSDMRKQYQMASADRLNQVKLKCMQYGIDFVPTDINSGVTEVLQTYLVKRKKMNII